MSESTQHPASVSGTGALIGDVVDELRKALADVQAGLNTAAESEIAQARQTSETAPKASLPPAAASALAADAKRREEEAVALQSLLDPVVKQAESALQALQARSMRAAQRLREHRS